MSAIFLLVHFACQLLKNVLFTVTFPNAMSTRNLDISREKCYLSYCRHHWNKTVHSFCKLPHFNLYKFVVASRVDSFKMRPVFENDKSSQMSHID